MTDPAPSLVDAIQNRYVIERELGRGGMALGRRTGAGLLITSLS